MEYEADSTKHIIPDLSLNSLNNRPSGAWFYVMSRHVPAAGGGIVRGGLTQL